MKASVTRHAVDPERTGAEIARDELGSQLRALNVADPDQEASRLIDAICNGEVPLTILQRQELLDTLASLEKLAKREEKVKAILGEATDMLRRFLGEPKKAG